MSMFPNPSQTRRPVELDYSGAGSSVVFRFMNTVYAWMCVGLATTAVVAWYVSQSPPALKLVGQSIWLLIIVELALVFIISAAVNKVGGTLATALFLLYAALNGATLAGIFIMFKLPALGGAFAVTAGTFGITSLYGFVTKRDLTGLGGILFMALIGLILASVVNIFLASSMLYWLVTYAGILIFVGLTAYDTQKLKKLAYQVEGNAAMASRMAIVGSLMLYLDFINLFLLMLRVMGDRR